MKERTDYRLNKGSPLSIGPVGVWHAGPDTPGGRREWGSAAVLVVLEQEPGEG